MLKELKTHIHYLLAAGLLGALVLVAAIVLANSNIYIKNLGSSTLQNSAIINSIAVSGSGKAYGKPDMARITFSASATASTSTQALADVNGKIAQALAVLQQNAIPEKDIETTNLSIYPEYDYQTTSRKLLGQKATQSLYVTIRGLDAKATKATSVIDGVAQISDIEIAGIYFDIQDRSQLEAQARSAAMEDARSKAAQLAQLAAVKLISPVSISDTSVSFSPTPMYAGAEARAIAADMAKSTSLSTGELEVNIQLSVLWGIE